MLLAYERPLCANSSRYGSAQGALSQLPGCASVAFGNNAGEKRKNQMKTARPERIERPTLRFIGNAALWSRAFHGAVTSFLFLRYCRRGCKIGSGPPISERSVGLA